jgi:hypothetical protein
LKGIEMGGSVGYLAEARGDLSYSILERLPSSDCFVPERKWLPNELRNFSVMELDRQVNLGMKSTPRGGKKEKNPYELFLYLSAVKVPWDWLKKQVDMAAKLI